MVTAMAILTASSTLPTMSDAAADANNNSIKGSLNCLKKASHSGSGGSWGSSLGPFFCNRLNASDDDNPCVREVSSRAAVSAGVRLEYSAANDYRVSEELKDEEIS